MKYGLKLGLEVHAQLQAQHKLFSLSRPRFSASPNSQVSFFDAALPGTQPKLSLECVRLAVRAGLALNAEIPRQFSFDRKHYMYPDQPSGYQITQFREPVAKNGYLDLYTRDLPQNVLKAYRTPFDHKERQLFERIRIQQIQMEQDTGKTSYIDDVSLVDLNRANMGLLELVTMPDFRSEYAAIAFIRKLQQLLRRLDVCSGDMETGAMRVDVNVSVMDVDSGRDLGDRCEIKNLFSTSAVKYAVRAEYKRQVDQLAQGHPIVKQTRGWDGRRTFKLRDKESALDYRYMPDPDIPTFQISAQVVDGVKRALPPLPDALLDQVLQTGASLADAKTLLDTKGGIEYVLQVCAELGTRSVPPGSGKLASQWLVNRWLGQSSTLPDLGQFVDLLVAVSTQQISTTTGKLIIKHMAQGYAGSIAEIIAEFDLGSAKPGASAPAEYRELHAACGEIIANHPDVVAKIKKGKRASLGFLLGQVMKETQGKFDPKEVSATLSSLVQK